MAPATILQHIIRFKFQRWYLMVILFCMALPVYANQIEIRYNMPDAKEVMLVWGINDWQYYNQAPEGTRKVGKVMHTPMKREGDEFVVHITIAAKQVIDCFFLTSKSQGPFRVKTTYWDYNMKSEQKGFHFTTDSSRIIKIKASVDFNAPASAVSFDSYARFIFVLMLLIALVVWVAKKKYAITRQGNIQQSAILVSVSLALIGGLLVTRIFIAGLAFQFLIKPLATIPRMLSSAREDLLFAGLLILVAAGLYLLVSKGKKIILGIYAILVIISWLIALANINITSMLGRPFNYPWLYYSDFLKSKDSAESIAANITWPYISACLLLLLSFLLLVWTLFQVYLKWPRLLLLFASVFLLSACIAILQKPVTGIKTANPVFYFLASLNTEGNTGFYNNKLNGVSDFDIKNADSLPGNYAASFRSSPVKNVILLVLESTPAEYVNGYNRSFNATPYLDSLQNQAAIFKNIYAHLPSTNTSMFSMLCSTYPHLSFKSVTVETPGLPVPSIASVLEKDNYRTLFLNSGDNRFQNAEDFLKKRGFDTVLDFRSNTCGTVFSDSRYSKDKLDGVDDSCLSVRFFDWQQQDTSRPFFAMLWTFQTHYPYFTAGKWLDFNTGNPSLDKYLNALHRADETLQQLVEGLRQQHLLDETLIVVTGDHGEAFGRHHQTTHASNIYEENLHVPLVLINPALFTGEKISTTGGLSDIAPTILSILNKPSPKEWQGENLFSLNRRKAVYFFTPFSDYLFGIREAQYKLIYNASENSLTLYDLAADPFESKDISKSKPELVNQLNGKLQAWMKYQSGYMEKLSTLPALK